MCSTVSSFALSCSQSMDHTETSRSWVRNASRAARTQEIEQDLLPHRQPFHFVENVLHQHAPKAECTLRHQLQPLQLQWQPIETTFSPLLPSVSRSGQHVQRAAHTHPPQSIQLLENTPPPMPPPASSRKSEHIFPNNFVFKYSKQQLPLAQHPNQAGQPVLCTTMQRRLPVRSTGQLLVI